MMHLAVVLCSSHIVMLAEKKKTKKRGSEMFLFVSVLRNNLTLVDNKILTKLE